MALEIRTREAGSVRLIELVGSLTIGGDELRLRDAFRGLAGAGHFRVVLDLAGVERIDSAGLGEIIACKKLAREGGGDVRLLRPRPKIRDVLVMSRLDQVLGIFDDEGEAIASL